MNSTFVLIFLVVSWAAAQSEEPPAEIDLTGRPVLPTITGGDTEDAGQGETGGTFDPNQSQDAAAPIPRCKPNESYRVCGTACELACENPLPVPCVSRCVRGCQCNSGYYRNKQGNCVRLANCPPRNPLTCATVDCLRGYVCRMIQGRPQCVPITPQCKPNETYQSCGTACEPSCEEPNPGRCTRQCVGGCQCNSGYYRNKQGNCVRRSDCPPVLTCATVLCIQGHICKENNGRPECVPGSKFEELMRISPKCKPNESYQTCGSACEPTCDLPYPDVCLAVCVVGCQCDNGYVRNKNGDCVRLNNCPPKEPTGCQAKKCPPRQTCALVIPSFCPAGHCGPQPSCVNSNPCLWTKCRPGQECVLRQVICVRAPCNPIAECIPSTVPPTPTFDPACPINEEYILCKNACSEKRCPQTPSVVCPAVCTGDGGCICKTGYYRNRSGRCVTLVGCNSTIE